MADELETEIEEVPETELNVPVIPEVEKEPENREPVIPVDKYTELVRENERLKLNQPPKVETPKVDEDPMPDPNDYADREIEFTRDLNRWDARKTAEAHVAKLLDAQDRKRAEEAQGDTYKKASENYKTQLDAELKLDPGLKKKMDLLPEIPLKDGRDFYLAKHQFAGKIVKHFANNPGDFNKYATLPVDEALQLLGSISSQFKAENPVQTKAPNLHPNIEGPAGGKTSGYKIGDGADAFLKHFYG